MEDRFFASFLQIALPKGRVIDTRVVNQPVRVLAELLTLPIVREVNTQRNRGNALLRALQKTNQILPLLESELPRRVNDASHLHVALTKSTLCHPQAVAT